MEMRPARQASFEARNLAKPDLNSVHGQKEINRDHRKRKSQIQRKIIIKSADLAVNEIDEGLHKFEIK